MASSSQHGSTGYRPRNRINLWPYRSLSIQSYRLLMLCLAGVMLVAGALFFAIGAWPVIGFMGLEILVIWMAFHMNYRAARRRETLEANRSTFRIKRVSPGGVTDVDELPTAWLKARIVASGPGRGRRERLVVSSHGREAEIGAFLHDSERKALLPEINAMLDRVRR